VVDARLGRGKPATIGVGLKDALPERKRKGSKTISEKKKWALNTTPQKETKKNTGGGEMIDWPWGMTSKRKRKGGK